MNTPKQTIKHDPENGLWGDCFRCAVAYMMDMHAEEVPHFMDGGRDHDVVWAEVDNWFMNRGWVLTHIPFAADPEQVLKTVASINPMPFLYIMGAMSARGVGHTCVCMKDQIVYDPSPEEDGFTGPMEDGHVWVNILTPLYKGE